MSRLAQTQLKKQKRKEFNKQFLKKYAFFLAIAGFVIAMMLGVALTVSKAVENHENTVDLIRNHQYVDVDFR
ncbi:MAG: hypothetical protein HXL58_03020 [Solobacterium sp.]|nr:hypothetical protein [Solobacterium sp.]